MKDRVYLRQRCVAALACLQPGIDPVFLTLVSANADIHSAAHGWIVGGTQGGMAIGSLVSWHLGVRLSRNSLLIAMVVAVFASLATAGLLDPMALTAVRAVYGLCMGLVFTNAMAQAAARQPGHAFGTMFLFQLVLASIVAALLPYVAASWGTSIALALLTCVPASIMVMLLVDKQPSAQRHMPLPLHDQKQICASTARLATAGLIATFSFICATMTIWSYSAAMAMAARLNETTIGWGIGIGSLCGAATALCVAHLAQHMKGLSVALFCALMMLTPFALISTGNDVGFFAAMALFNIGSTGMIIRCSTIAVDLHQSDFWRRATATMHSMGMIAGPLLGSLGISLGKESGLQAVAIFALALGLGALFVVNRTPKAPSRLSEILSVSKWREYRR